MKGEIQKYEFEIRRNLGADDLIKRVVANISECLREVPGMAETTFMALRGDNCARRKRLCKGDFTQRAEFQSSLDTSAIQSAIRHSTLCQTVGEHYHPMSFIASRTFCITRSKAGIVHQQGGRGVYLLP